MNITKVIIAISFSLFYMTSAIAENKLRTKFEKPVNKEETNIQKELKASDTTKAVVELINEIIKLSKPLTIVYGGSDGPLFDSRTNEIIIPYSFVQEIKRRFITVKYSESGVSVADATMDALMHTLFHEIGHALIYMHELPVLGKEEDAVDSLATVLLIEYFEDGQEIAISAADLFDLESDDITEFGEQDFWDEHSLDAQRFYNTLCHVYGSNPKQYKYLLKDGLFSEDRAVLCIEEYEHILSSWLKLLKPYLKSVK